MISLPKVYMADYNGRNAAAKVMQTEQEHVDEDDDGDVEHKEKRELVSLLIAENIEQ